MANDLISGNKVLRAAERIRAQREAERAQAAKAVQPIPSTQPIRNTAQIRAPLNVMPDEETLAGLISRGLAALSRGIRWARGSIVNLVV